MAAKTCLLCGKPLSRIWAGTGEDFCSQEHRNQYRLRRGMDRLLEANKVASVMRRRENPKQIPAGNLRAPGPASSRAFLAPARAAAPPLAIRSPRITGRPKLASVSRFKTPEALAGEQAESRPLATPAAFAGPAARAPKLPVRMAAHVTAAPPARLRALTGKHTVSLTAAIRWLGSGRPVIAKLLAQSERRKSGPMSAARPARRVSAPSLGRALRVSVSSAFHLPKKALPSSRYALPATEPPATRGPRRLTAAVAPNAVEITAQTIETAPAEMRLPAAPPANFQRRFRWPEAFETKLSFLNAANEARVSAVAFGRPEEFAAKERK
jgi:hypothetical protein